MKKLILGLIVAFAFSALPVSAGPLKSAGKAAVKSGAFAGKAVAKGAKAAGKGIRHAF